MLPAQSLEFNIYLLIIVLIGSHIPLLLENCLKHFASHFAQNVLKTK